MLSRPTFLLGLYLGALSTAALHACSQVWWG